ncbi:MAG: cupredoxin domain-containing protein [Methylococcaceae bacterium]|nr:cupredoxin domain-containing protein [Methylococcaceae bacterium]
MIRKIIFTTVISLAISSPAYSEKEFLDHTALMDHGDGHFMDMDGGMIMGQNTDTLPGGCSKIAATEEITVHAGHKYSEKFPGTMFAFDTQEFHFKPCTKLTIHFINDDNVRHQFMMHGLPKYLYPKGMFHMEVTGPGKITGTLIFPPNDKTYLVHCDISQHMEKGMKAQLKIGKGSGDLPSIPGVTAQVIQDDYSNSIAEEPVAPVTKKKGKDGKVIAEKEPIISGVTIIGLAVGLVLAPFLGRRFKGMNPSEIVNSIFESLAKGIGLIINLIKKLIGLVSSKKTLEPPK